MISLCQQSLNELKPKGEIFRQRYLDFSILWSVPLNLRPLIANYLSIIIINCWWQKIS